MENVQLTVIIAIGVSLGTLFVAIGGMILTVVNSTRTAKIEDIRLLNDRLDTVQGDLKDERQRHAECERRLEDINKENMNLMRELIKAGIHPSVLSSQQIQ